VAPEPSAPAETAEPATPPSAPSDPTPFQDLAAAEILKLNQRWTGDYDELTEQRFLRVLVPYSRTLYYLDGPVQKGVAFESLREFEKTLPTIGKSKVRPKIVVIPTTRDRLLPALAEGYGDIAIGAFTVTDLRRDSVDFSEPTLSGIEDVVVTGKNAAAIAREADLAGREIHVRRESAYYDDLVALNERLKKAGLRPVSIREIDAKLEDEDVLQMVDAGILPATVAKRPIAEFWVQLYDQLAVHPGVPLRSDGQIAWALRKNTPKLREIVNKFVVKHRAGTLFGNVLLKRYLGSAERLKNPTSEAELKKYREMAHHFQTYADQYGADWLLVVAQGYQESQLNQRKRSPAGAVGVMQIKPSTAADPNVGIKGVDVLENNIHASIKYMRFLQDRYFADESMDRLNRGLFTLAAYNAGPARVAQLRKKAQVAGLDPNLWFNNVEIIAAREIGRETVDYVSNIYKYYTAYRAIAAQRAAEKAAPAT
jgi:membrane-bound lytic murein transglycosylase MltF